MNFEKQIISNVFEFFYYAPNILINKLIYFYNEMKMIDNFIVDLQLNFT